MEIKNYWLYNLPIAHRGLHNDIYPENTSGAYVNAINNGYAIETDVQLTKDGVLVCYHDYLLTRGAGTDKDIRDLTYEEIKNLKVFSSDYKILTFDELLELVDGKTPILIEVKPQKISGIEQKLVNSLKDYKGEFALQSFSPFIIKELSNLAPNYHLGVLATLEYFKDLTLLQNLYLRRIWYRFNVKFNFLSVRVEDLKKFNKRAKKYNLISWTIKDDNDVKIAEKFAKNIIFENVKNLGKFEPKKRIKTNEKG